MHEFSTWLMDGSQRILICGIPAWRCVLFLITLMGALVVSRIVEWLVEKKILATNLPTAGNFSQNLAKLSAPVIRWAALLLIARQALRFLLLTPELESWLMELFKAGYVVLVAYTLSRAVQLLLDLWVARADDGSSANVRRSVVPVAKKLARIGIFLIAFLLILQNAGYNVGSMVAGLGLGGLAVALAAQETLANLFGSLAIFMDKPFIVGERIQLDKYDGTVEKIGIRSTSVRQLNGTLAVIPNRLVAQSAINNISRRKKINHSMVVSLEPKTSVEKTREALEILRGIYQNHPMTAQADIFWRDFSGTSVDITVGYWCATTDYAQFTRAMEEINMEIKKRFAEAGIELYSPLEALAARGRT
jgi:MscS family membrane protein